MKKQIILLICVAVLGCGQKPEGHGTAHDNKSHEHKEEAKPGMEGHGGHEGHGGGHTHRKVTEIAVLTPDGIKSGTPFALRLQIQDSKGGVAKAFQTNHEAKVHLIIVRQGMDLFDHVHPAIDSETGTLSVMHTFPAAGIYRLYADYQEQGQEPALGTARVEVLGDAVPAPSLVPDAPGTVKGSGLTAKVTIPDLKADTATTVRFEILDESGSPVNDLEPYMGAMGHFVGISQDGKQYVHAHPMDGKAQAKNVVQFEARFETPGVYKGWGQFKRGGMVKVIPFVVKVP